MFLIHSFVEVNKYFTAVRCQGLFWVLGCGDRIVLSQKSVSLCCHVRAWQEHEGRAGRKAGMLGGRGDGEGHGLFFFPWMIERTIFCPLILVLGEPIQFRRFHSLSPHCWGGHMT